MALWWMSRLCAQRSRSSSSWLVWFFMEIIPLVEASGELQLQLQFVWFLSIEALN
jgi:hypothetical protein